MKPELARKSMKLFAEHVAPTLRKDSAELFARQYPQLEAHQVSGAAEWAVGLSKYEVVQFGSLKRAKAHH